MFRRLEYNFFSKQRRIFNRIFLKIHNDFVILPNIFYPNVKEKIRIVKYMKGFKLLMEFKKLISYIYVKLVKSRIGQASRGASFNARPEVDAFPREIHRVRSVIHSD